MSTVAFKKWLTGLKGDLKRSTKGERAALNKKRSYLIISQEAFEKGMMPPNPTKGEEKLVKKLAEIFHKTCIDLRKPQNIPGNPSSALGSAIDQKQLAVFPSKASADRFAKEVKQKVFNFLQSKQGKRHTLVGDVRELVNPLNQKGGESGMHLGHALGIVSLQDHKALTKVDASDHSVPSEIKDSIKTYTETLKETDIKGTIVKYFSRSIVKGEVAIIFREPRKANQERGSVAQEVKKNFLKQILGHIARIYKMSSSPSFKDGVKNAVVEPLKGNKVKTKRYKSTATASGKKSKKSSRRPVDVYGIPLPQLRNRQGRFSSTANLMVLINASLAEVIRTNMVAPRLINRTGRFSESAHVTHISRSRNDMLSIYYTYMKNPYQTFEPGYAQGSSARDPKKLISKSIRHIAAALVSQDLRIIGA